MIDRALVSRANLEQQLLVQGLRVKNVLLLNQIHGAAVVVVDDAAKIYGKQNLPKADAIVTNLPEIAVGVVTADCAPVLLFDQEKSVVAALHAGWKGAKAGIVQATVQEMKNLGASRISAIIGPMIRQESYEVSQDFYDDFLKEDAENSAFFVAGEVVGKYMFNLPAYVAKKLRQAGVNQVQDLAIDTYKNEKDFFSFRRSKHKEEADCGRNVSLIAIN